MGSSPASGGPASLVWREWPLAGGGVKNLFYTRIADREMQAKLCWLRLVIVCADRAKQFDTAAGRTLEAH